MNRQYSFDPSAYRKRNLPWLSVVWVISLLLDVIIVWTLITLKQSAANNSQALVYGSIALIFLLFMNTLLIKGVGIYIYFQRKKERTQGTVTILENSVSHIEKVTRYSRLQVRLRLGILFNNEKEFYDIQDRYHILEIEGVKKDSFGNLHITGKIEMQLINEFLDNSPDLDWDSSQKVILSKHTIPAFYENMDELYIQMKAISKNLNSCEVID